MTKGTYFGGTWGSPWGLGFGGYVDNYGRIYPQLYFGSPGFSGSAGYTPDLEGFLTGLSVSGNMGEGSIKAGFGTSGSSHTVSYGIGSPGAGLTYGFGPYEATGAPPDATGEVNGAIYNTGFGLPGTDLVAAPATRQMPTNRVSAIDGAAPFANRFGNWRPSLPSAGKPGRTPDVSKDLAPSQGQRTGGASAASPFVTGAPAVPFVSTPDSPLAPAAPAPFANRFGNWGSSPPPAPQQPVRQPQSSTPTQLDPRNIRVLSRVSPNGGGAQKAGPLPPGAANQSSHQTGKPLGIVTGPPAPDVPVPPMVYGLPDPSNRSGDDMADWFERWIKPLVQP